MAVGVGGTVWWWNAMAIRGDWGTSHWVEGIGYCGNSVLVERCGELGELGNMSCGNGLVMERCGKAGELGERLVVERCGKAGELGDITLGWGERGDGLTVEHRIRSI